MKAYRLFFFFLFLLFFVSHETQAQIGFQPDSSKSFNNQTVKKNPSLWKYKRLGVSMEMGVGISGSKSSFGTYAFVAPFFNYRVSPRFRLDVGAIYTQGFNNLSSSEFQGFNGNSSNLSLFVRGNYLVSDKLIISGAVYKTFDLNKPQTSDLSVQKKTFENYGAIVCIDYKISENLTIGAQVNFSNRNSNPYPYNSRDNYFGGFQPGYNQYNPFGFNNRFQSGFCGW